MVEVTTMEPAADLAFLRRLLRQREYRRALELLDRHPPASSSVPLEDLRTYAYELLVRRGAEPSRRMPVNLRRGVPVSLRRPIPVDLRRLDRPALDRVLRWLLSSELRAAEEALLADDYETTLDVAEQAAQIDDRSTKLSFLHARALYELAVLALDEPPTDLDYIAGQLQRAARLVNRAALDPALREPHKKLSTAIDDVAAIVARRRARAAQIEAVNGVVRRFNQLVSYYDKSQIVSHVQVGNARASLAQIRADVDRLLRQHAPDSPAGRLLADLQVKCSRYRDRLERVGRTVRD